MDYRDSLNVVVFGQKYVSALDIVRSLGSAGINVYLLMVTDSEMEYKIVSSSKFIHGAKRCSHNTDSIIEELCEFTGSVNDRPVLFPIDDYSMQFIDDNFETLSDHYILPLKNGQKKGDITRLLDKHNQSRIARENGLLTPKEWIVNLGEFSDVPDEITYPCYCKTASSVDGRKTEQKKCNDADELCSHLLTMKKRNPDRSVVIQEFLDISKEYIVLGMCSNYGAIVVGIVDKVICTLYTPGLVVVGRLMKPEEVHGFSEIMPRIYSFLNSVNYVGLFDLEFNQSKDQLYFNEFNLRASGLGYCVKKAGANLPLMFLSSLVGGKKNTIICPDIEFGRLFIKEKNALKDFEEKKISLKQLCEYYKESVDKLMSEKGDNAPTRYYYLYSFKRIAKRRILR